MTACVHGRCCVAAMAAAPALRRVQARMATFLAAVLLLQACLLAAAWEASPISGHSSGGQHLPTMRHAHHPGGWPVDGQHRAGGRTLDPPHLRPLRQSAVQRAVIEKVVRAAVVDSPAATARVLAFLDSPAFRVSGSVAITHQLEHPGEFSFVILVLSPLLPHTLPTCPKSKPTAVSHQGVCVHRRGCGSAVQRWRP